MSAEQERRDQQAEIDAEVAASAAAMSAHRVLNHGQVAVVEDVAEQRVAVAGVLREQFLDARERHLAVLERAAQQREASSLLRSELLDAREREIGAREQAADQREIDAELASWPDAGASSS